MSNAYAKLPHEVQAMCDDAEAAADFLQWFDRGDKVVMSSDGGTWPIDHDQFARWEQSIRNLKQMVLHNG